MIICRTDNKKIIKKIIEETYSDFRSDADSETVENIPLENMEYWIGYKKTNPIGLVVFETMDKHKIHVFMRPSFKHLFYWFVKRVLEMKEKPVYAEIPSIRTNVINFANKLGFEIIAKDKTCTIRGVNFVVFTMRLA